VIVASDFGSAVPEARRQQAAWKKYIDLSKVKAFVNIAISPAVEWGTRNLVLSAGLGGMRPNIVVMGAYNMHEFRAAQPLVDVPSMPASEMEQGNTYNPQVIQENGRRVEKQQGLLPTDNCRTEGAVGIQSYVAILEDLLLQLQINVAVAKGFKDLKFPRPTEGNTRKYIDLWPIQMSAEIAMCGREDKQNILTTNFDTYTLILQLGCILNTVPAWKKVYRLRVAVFVEYESDVEEERGRVKTLLDNLRIQAEILVFWLASGEIKSYQLIVNGDSAAVGRDAERTVHDVLKDEEWWQDVLKLRGRREDMSAVEELAEARELLSATPNWPSSSFQHGRRGSPAERFEGLKRLIRKSKRRRSISGFGELGGVRPAMRTHRLHDDLVHRHASHASASEDSESEDSEILENGHSDRASTLSKASAATENDMDDYEGEFEEQGNGETTVSNFPSRITRRRSQGDSIRGPKPPTRPSPKESRLKALTATDEKKPPTLSETASTTPQAPPKQDLPSISNPDKPSEASLTARPRIMRHSTAAARFSSNPVPRTTVASEDGPGPSIMFTESSSPSHVGRHPSIYKHPNNPSSSSPTPSNAATGFPFPQSVPLSFNDLPCRAQHLILNELMQKQSKDTAVLFTTLPSPVEGTCKNEEECVGYLSDLEVLCENLPPILLVHSNSMTVTCSL